MSHIKKFTVIIFCTNGRVLKYHNMQENKLQKDCNKLAELHGGWTHANLYHPLMKSFEGQIRPELHKK